MDTRIRIRIRPHRGSNAAHREGAFTAGDFAACASADSGEKEGNMRFSIIAGLAFGAAAGGFLSGIAPREEDAGAIVRRSVEAARTNYQAAPRFDYRVTTRAKNGGTRTYEAKMLFGSRYLRLIAIDGKPPTAEIAAEEQKKLNEAGLARSRESPEERARRVSGYERERQRDQAMLMEMTNAFEFRAAGEETLNGREVYVLKAKPRKGYRPPNSRAKVLTGMEGTLWVDKRTLQWARIDAEVIHPVTIEGFFARVQPGTRFQMDLMPVTETIWFPRRFLMETRARVLFFWTAREVRDESYCCYTPAKDGETQGGSRLGEVR